MATRGKYAVWTASGPGWPMQTAGLRCRTPWLSWAGAYAYARELAAAGAHFATVRAVNAAAPEAVMPWCQQRVGDALCGRGDLVDDGARGLARCPEHVPPPPAPMALPSAPTVMDPVAAAWIREHALRPRHRADQQYYRVMIELCACQLGLCGACGRDQHQRCLNNNERAGRASPEAYLTDFDGTVRAQVWQIGTPCQYRCPCPTCHQLAAIEPAPAPPLAPPVAPAPAQLSLF